MVKISDAKIPKPKATLGEEIEDIDASASYDKDEFNYDPKGYFLIRIIPEKKKIEVGHCKQNNVILKKWSGNTAKELCQAIIKSDAISRSDHAAYLGRETLKAEVALKLGIEYVQDSDLELK
ncbi:hypothetical protein CMO88_03840 [Candidatus Woesearchaeota archaeon]|nr:hypothetical protein [Candidatus Woesearchaeota archaeon]|tara:strand:- start:33635 stop:34000 length:366 start_codon:yes stop_codon:yes gene_type:complete